MLRRERMGWLSLQESLANPAYKDDASNLGFNANSKAQQKRRGISSLRARQSND